MKTGRMAMRVAVGVISGSLIVALPALPAAANDGAGNVSAEACAPPAAAYDVNVSLVINGEASFQSGPFSQSGQGRLFAEGVVQGIALGQPDPLFPHIRVSESVRFQSSSIQLDSTLTRTGIENDGVTPWRVTIEETATGEAMPEYGHENSGVILDYRSDACAMYAVISFFGKINVRQTRSPGGVSRFTEEQTLYKLIVPFTYREGAMSTTWRESFPIGLTSRSGIFPYLSFNNGVPPTRNDVTANVTLTPSTELTFTTSLEEMEASESPRWRDAGSKAFEGNPMRARLTISAPSATQATFRLRHPSTGRILATVNNVSVPKGTSTVFIPFILDGIYYAPNTDGLRQHYLVERIRNGQVITSSAAQVDVLPRPVVGVPDWYQPADGAAQQARAGAPGDFPDLGTHVGQSPYSKPMQSGGLLGNETYGTLAQNAERIAEHVESVRRDTGAWQVDMLAPGYGGLAARVYIDQLMPATKLATPSGVVNPRPVQRLILLGTPNLGTPCAAVTGQIGMAEAHPLSVWNNHEQMNELHGVRVHLIASNKESTTCGVPGVGGGLFPRDSVFGLPGVASTHEVSFDDRQMGHHLTLRSLLHTLLSQQSGSVEWQTDTAWARPARPRWGATIPQITAGTSSLPSAKKRNSVPFSFTSQREALTLASWAAGASQANLTGPNRFNTIVSVQSGVSVQLTSLPTTAGTWTLNYNAPISAFSFAVLAPKTKAKLSADAVRNTKSNTTLVTASLRQGKKLLKGTVYTGTVTYLDGTTEKVVLRDTGAGGDNRARDGVFSATISSNKPGVIAITAKTKSVTRIAYLPVR